MTPRSAGYRMPPEWAPHRRTLVSWPVKASMCHPETHERVQAGYAEFVRAIAEFEPVTILVNRGEAAAVQAMCGDRQIRCLEVPHNDSWLRDNGPTFVTDASGQLAGINWRFNAWGGKYSPWDLDDAVAPAVLAHMEARRFDAPLVMEGGSLHTDGEGTLLTTEECLLNPNRNPSMDREAIEAHLAAHLGIDRVIWLGRGLDGDETDGHVDNIACFAAPGKILLQACSDPDDPNFAVTQAALAALHDARDAHGRSLEVVCIPQPPMRRVEDTRLTLSYLNFYFVNGGIILPVFGGDAAKTDREAIRILSEVFPDRRIRPIDGMGIVTEGGNVHCATQQVPA